MTSGLIGRDRELADLLCILDGAVGGIPQLVTCSGEAGIGKTRLMTELAGRARSRGIRTLWSRAMELPDAPPFRLWQPVLGDGFGDEPISGRAALFERFAARLDSGGTPTLFVIDDVQWADEPSLLGLLHVVRQLRTQRILVCVTERDTLADAAPGWRVIKPELLREAAARTIHLAGLTSTAAAACLAAEAEQPVPDELAVRVHAATGGNPFYLREFGRAFRDGADRRLPVPATLRQVIQGRVARSSPRAQEFLRAASIMGDQFAIAVVARLIGRPAAECLSAVDEAAATGLLTTTTEPGSMRFGHALVKEALREGLPLQQRVVWHTRAANAIEALYPDALDAFSAALAWHYAEAAIAGDREPARRWALRAGDLALRELAFEEAVRLYGLAVANADDATPGKRSRMLLARATASQRAGDLAAARADCSAAVALARRTNDATLSAECALVLEPIGDRLWDRDIHAWCAEALAGDVPDLLRARLLARLTEAAVYLGQLDEVAETSSAAMALAATVADDETSVAALRARQLACTGPEHRDEYAVLAAEMVSAGVRTGDAAAEMWGHLWTIDSLWARGAITGIATELSRLRWCVRHTGGPMANWHLLIAEAALAQGRGDLAEATRLGEEAYRLAESVAHPAGEGAYRALLTVIGHHGGQSDVSCTPPPPRMSGEVRNALFAALGMAFPLVERGRLHEGESLYRSLGPPQKWEIPPYFLLDALVTGGAVASRLGAVDDIRYFADRLGEHRGFHVAGTGGSGHYLGPVELWLGKFAAALGDADSAAADLRSAGRICRDISARCFAVEADCELAELVVADAPEEALALAKRALPLAESCGMAPWAQRLRTIIGVYAQSTTLSPRELEVAELVATGATNRDIARILIISERTAQNHVQHILTKLGVNNRSQITAWMRRSG
ncbi:ATP-binding protein [Nocardia sp. bgisy118]|uniref:ATP-binding protein n=1 Tax=Nocardia sp. bgisy118 TaxID=3413786 RepID=UPI003F4A7F32